MRSSNPKAYVVSDVTDPGHADLVYADTAGKAKAYADLDTPYTQRRAKRLPAMDDAFALSRGKRYERLILDHDWWMECGGCHTIVREDNFGIMEGSTPFCIICAERKHPGGPLY